MNASVKITEPTVNRPLETYQTVGRILGPAVFALLLVTDQWQDAMNPQAWRAAAIGMWMAIWWATEAVPVPVTAFLPLVIFEPLGIANLRDAAAPYANPIIYLFLGGFLMALALERWNLHRRIALAILDRTGTDGRRLIGGFMFVCAMLSMWMTNTSTTMMLLPIVLSVVAVIRDNVAGLSEKSRSDFQVAMLLGLAYSASIGGLATLIGTPPNALLIGYLAENYGIEISFARWMTVGVPVTLVMLPIAWFLLTRFLFPVNIPASEAVNQHLHKLREEMGPITTPERRVAVIFVAVILSWMFRRPVTEMLGLTGVSDAGIVMTAGVLLFMLPSGNPAQP
ncbi:MAG: SLC13 family permease, partial [Gammaproteobacteria bacterium]|nr:SLC13 family permease [Gammaproteobacteria bacterium]